MAPRLTGAPGVRSSLALTTRSSGTVTRTSIFSASIGDGEAGAAPSSGFVTYSVCSVAYAESLARARI